VDFFAGVAFALVFFGFGALALLLYIVFMTVRTHYYFPTRTLQVLGTVFIVLVVGGLILYFRNYSGPL